MDKEKTFAIRVYGKSELAGLYKVSLKTFNKWLDTVRERCPELFPPKKDDRSRLLTPAQVKKFFEHIGEPPET